MTSRGDIANGSTGAAAPGLRLIVGPPRSGKAGAVLDRFEHHLSRMPEGGAEPLLVVPTLDDVDRFERELSGRPAAGLGGSVTSFPGLFGEVASATGCEAPPELTAIQRVWLARTAVRGSDLGILRRSARHEGFAPALEALLTDLQSAGLDAASFKLMIADAKADGGGRYEDELASLFESYERLRDGLGLGDAHGLAVAATRALRTAPGRWRGRPVLLYGFDDLAVEQVELVAALSRAAEVTVALGFEDRAALAARARLLGVLRDELGGEVVEELEPDGAYTPSPTLFHLERNLFEPEPGTAACDPSLTLLESAGDRGEAKLIARRIAALIDAGVDPGEIAIAVRSPDRTGPLLARVLASFGIPVAAEARVPLAATSTGTALRRLLRIACGEGEAADVVSLLRLLQAGGGPRPRDVDWLERQVRRRRLAGAEEALEAWEARGGRPIRPLQRLRGGQKPAGLASTLAEIAAEIAERPHMRAGARPSSGDAIELRAAAEVARALGEAARLGPYAPGLEEMGELLGHVRVRLWRGPTEGRVRVLSPYRLRASRVTHLFVAGLVDGSFPAPGSREPLLPEGRRRELGIASRQDPETEERYLFYTCVSRPEQGLHLSYPAADESGASLSRSPFVDEVRALLEPPPAPDPADDPLEESLAERAGVGAVAVEPHRAASTRDLARALAAAPATSAQRELEALELPEQVRCDARAAVDRARAAVEAARAPGPLRAPELLADLGERSAYGASTLEEYDLCPYRWFVSHELDPQRIDPDPEPLEAGSVVHEALERLYRDAPAAGGHKPTEATLAEWVSESRRRLAEAAEARGWDADSAMARIGLSRLEAVVERFLRREAATGGPMDPDPELLEAAFGTADEDAHPAADLGGFLLHGRIDRIDVSSDRKALIRDYKLSRSAVAGRKLLEEGRLQLPLYMKAVEGMGLEPIGGVYHPLGATGEREDRPRGLLAAEHRDALIPGGTDAHVSTDFLSDEQLEAIVEEAAQRSREIVASIRTGEVSRDPRGGSCPRWCGFAPICRIERGVAVLDEDESEEEGEA